MYNQIPEAAYSHDQQRLAWAIHPYFFTDVEKYGQHATNILLHAVQYWQHNYAAFLAHRERWMHTGNRLDTIFLGIQAAHNFASFWDHVGYVLYSSFGLPIAEKEVNFSNAVDSLREHVVESKRSCRDLLRWFNEEAELRNKYRNPSMHRILPMFQVEGELPDDSDEKLKHLTHLLTAGHERIVKALKTVNELVVKWAPSQVYGTITRGRPARKPNSDPDGAQGPWAQELDLSRAQVVAERVLREHGVTAILKWGPTEWDELNVKLHNEIMTECLEVPPELRFRISGAIKHRGVWNIRIAVEREQAEFDVLLIDSTDEDT